MTSRASLLRRSRNSSSSPDVVYESSRTPLSTSTTCSLDLHRALAGDEAAREHLADAELRRRLDLGEPLARDQEVDELLGVDLDLRQAAELSVDPIAQRVAAPILGAGSADVSEAHHTRV